MKRDLLSALYDRVVGIIGEGLTRRLFTPFYPR